jgi:hypothetical protein
MLSKPSSYDVTEKYPLNDPRSGKKNKTKQNMTVYKAKILNAIFPDSLCSLQVEK